MTQLDHLSALDSAFLHLEDGVNHMSIGSCAVFEGPAPDFDEFVELVAGKLPLLPRYRQKVRFVPGDLGAPVWVDDATFDLSQHVRHTALADPHRLADLEALMGWIMSQELDRQRPLWEMWMVDDLPDDQWAVISKVHHCMVDGVSGTDMMARLLDTTRESSDVVAVRWAPSAEPSGTTLVADALGRMVGTPGALLRLAGTMARSPRRALASTWAAVRGAQTLGSDLRPGPLLSIQGSIGPQRRWAVARAPLADAKTVRRRFSTTINDVVVAAITTAFRDVLIERGDDVESAVVRAMVPVSVRAAGDTTQNNQVSMMLARLPVGIDDPLDRLRAVQQELARVKGSHEADVGQLFTSGAGLAAPPVVAATLRLATSALRAMPQRVVTTITTNVPGPQIPLYAAGRQLLAYYPFVPLVQGIRIAVGIISYNGSLAFGVTGDDDSIGDLEPFCRRIEHEIDALRHLVPEH